MKKQPHVAGVRCVCVLVHKTDREEVKNESVTEQSQYWGAELLSLESKGCHQSHDTHTGVSSRPHHPNRVKAEVLVGAENTQCG